MSDDPELDELRARHRQRQRWHAQLMRLPPGHPDEDELIDKLEHCDDAND